MDNFFNDFFQQLLLFLVVVVVVLRSLIHLCGVSSFSNLWGTTEAGDVPWWRALLCWKGLTPPLHILVFRWKETQASGPGGGGGGGGDGYRTRMRGPLVFLAT